MKRLAKVCVLLLALLAGFLHAGAEKAAEEIVTIAALDGVTFDGKLSMPVGGADKLVIYVNGSGPNTYDNRREYADGGFDYFAVFAEQFTARGVAFFSYNTRGVTPGEMPPYFANIDEAVYRTYIPSNEVWDIVCIIRRLTAMPALSGAKVYLLGWSAGTIIAPQVVLTGAARVDALLLCGYANDTMAEILDWQQRGGSSMVFYRQYFDYDGDGGVSPEEFAEDRFGISAVFGGAAFEEIDVDGDAVLSEADFAIILREKREAVLAAFENGDDAWLRANYSVPLTAAWYRDYAKFPPNSETLVTLDLPIYIFHGAYDANTSAEGVRRIAETFSALGKDNLATAIFDHADHDLNYMEYIVYGTLPTGLQALFDTVGALGR